MLEGCSTKNCFEGVGLKGGLTIAFIIEEGHNEL